MTDTCKYQLLSPDSVGAGKDLVKGKTAEEGLLRIQSLLAEWLRMENVVVLAAAGCSVKAGGRLMGGPASKNLECLVLDAVEKCDLSSEAKAIIEWRKANKPDKGNFEEWLSFLFSAGGLVKTKGTPIHSITWKQVSQNSKDNELTLSSENAKILQEYIERAIYAECALELNRNELTNEESETSGHIPFLAKLIARDANLGRTHLFTLNYDTLFEQALEELGIQYFDGFSGKTSAHFDPAVYGLDIYYPGDVAEGRVRRFDKFLQFYKLHGSIHWFVEDGIYRSQHRSLSLVKEYREYGPIDKAAKLQSDEYRDIGSFGILPTSQKLSQTLNMPYAHLFRLFHARLHQPQTFLMVLGYGFGDDHVTRIIESALSNPSLVMLVVEPDLNSEIMQRLSRYQNLGQRVFVLTENLEQNKECSHKIATFSDFAQKVMPDVKWLEDFRRLRQFEKQIQKSEDGEQNKLSGDS